MKFLWSELLNYPLLYTQKFIYREIHKKEDFIDGRALVIIVFQTKKKFWQTSIICLQGWANNLYIDIDIPI